MHRDLARLLVVLAVARVLTLACLPPVAPSTDGSPRRGELDRPLRTHVAHRRSAAPRSSGPGHAAPPPATRGQLLVRPAGVLPPAGPDLALRPAAGPDGPGDVIPTVQGRSNSRPADPVPAARAANLRIGNGFSTPDEG